MLEIHELTMSGLTIDMLRKLVTDRINHPDPTGMNDQIHMELVNLAEALASPDGFNVRFEFGYNS